MGIIINGVPYEREDFKQTLAKTREYLDYLERHYDNVQKAFKEFDRRIYIKWNDDKYNDLVSAIWEEYEFFVDDIIAIHDISKFSQEEFIPYRKNFFPINEKEKEENKKDFEKAVQHHIANNEHHWQKRAEVGVSHGFNIVENVIDWIAMSYEFNEPIRQYWDKNKDKIKVCDFDAKIINLVYDLFEEDI